MGSAQRKVTRASRAVPEQARPHLFRGKVLRPEPPPGILTRPRLHALLDDGVARGVVLVSAPAATGKTWAVADWAGQVQHRADVGWVTLDDPDRAPGRFLRYVLAALDCTPAGHDALAGLAPLPPFSPPDERYLADVADALARLPHRVVLVLDEFEHVVGSETETLVRRILRYPPGQVRVVVISRVEPDIGQGRLRLDGRLMEIRGRVLALTREETRALMASHGVPVGERAALEVHDKTHGWVAAVTLVTSTLAQAPDPTAAIAALPAREPALRSLLSEVYDEQRPALRRIMRRACVTDLLCGHLVDALAGGNEGHAALQELERANLVAAVAHGDGEWYRWEPMLATLLHGRLHASDPDLERDLHRVAARWFRQDGQPVPAVEHFPRRRRPGDRRGRPVRVLAGPGRRRRVGGPHAAARPVRRRGRDHAPRARRGRSVPGCAGRRRRRLARARAHRDRPRARPPWPPPQRRGDDGDGGQAVRRHHDRPAVRGRRRRDRTEAARADVGCPDRLEPRGTHPAGTAPVQPRRLRDLPPAVRRGVPPPLRRVGGGREARHALPLAVLRRQLVEHDFRDGSLAQGRARAREVLDAAEHRGWHSYHGLTAAHVNLAAIAVSEDDLDAALDHLAEAERVARPVDHLGSFRIQVLRVFALCAAGRVTEAADDLDLLHARLDGVDPPAWVEVSLTLADAMRDACDGHPDAALRRLDPVHGRSCSPETLDDLQLVRARLLLGAGRPTEAHAEVAAVLGRGPRRPARVTAAVLDALASEMLGRHEEALELVDEALGATGDERLVRPFVAPGTPARQLLEQLVERGTAHEASSPGRPSGAGNDREWDVGRRPAPVVRNGTGASGKSADACLGSRGRAGRSGRPRDRGRRRTAWTG